MGFFKTYLEERKLKRERNSKEKEILDEKLNRFLVAQKMIKESNEKFLNSNSAFAFIVKHERDEREKNKEEFVADVINRVSFMDTSTALAICSKYCN